MSTGNYKMNNKRFATVQQIPEIYKGAFTLSSVRWLLFNRETNGLNVCVRKIGKKLIIDLDEFEKWVSKQQ